MQADIPAQTKSGAERPSVLFCVLLAAALLIFIQIFALMSPILLSLLLILLISLAVNPVIARMRAWTGGRRGATALLALILLGVIGLTGWAFSVPMKDSVIGFANQLPEYWERLQKPLIKLEQQAVDSENRLQAEVTKEIATEKAAAEAADHDLEPAAAETARPKPEAEAEAKKADAAPGSVRTNLGQMFQGLFGRFTDVAFSAAQILVVLVTVFFGVIYTLRNPRPIFWAAFTLVPERHHDQALTIMQRIGKFVPRWAGATLLGMVIIGLLVFFVMWPFFGFMDALVLGLIASVMEAVPYIGPFLSAVPALLLAFGKSVRGQMIQARPSSYAENLNPHVGCQVFGMKTAVDVERDCARSAGRPSAKARGFWSLVSGQASRPRSGLQKSPQKGATQPTRNPQPATRPSASGGQSPTAPVGSDQRERHPSPWFEAELR